MECFRISPRRVHSLSACSNSTAAVVVLLCLLFAMPGFADISTLSAIPGDAQVFLSWSASTGATNYVVQRSTTTGGPYSTVGSAAGESYLDTGLVNGITYYYVVYAIGTSGTSPLSPEAAVTPSTAPQMIKSDTTTMDAAADWSGIVPGIGEVGLFNNIISAANEAALTLGGNVTLGGLIFMNDLNGPVTIASGNTLTIGGSGIDMSRANQNVAFGSTIVLAADQPWNVAGNQSLTVNGTFISVSNTVVKTGGGVLYLGTPANDTGANIQVNSGVVQANASSGIMISLNGGAFDVNAFDANPINVLSGGMEQNVSGNRTWAGNLTGSGPLAVIASSIHTWSGNNSSYTGTITLQGSGTLRLSSLTAVSPMTAYNFNGGTMNASASGLFSLGSLAGSGTLNTASGGNFSIGALGTNSTYSGIIAGAGYVQKNGGGTLVLTGANTYTGGTTVNGGTLLVNNSSGSGTGTGAVIVNSGGALGGNGIVSGAVTVNSGGMLAPGSPIGVFTISNNLALTGGSTLLVQVEHSPLTNGVVQTSGALTQGGTLIVTNVGVASLAAGDSFKFFNAASYSGSFGNVILPLLPAGLAWNTNLLGISGTISVVARPFISNLSVSEGGLVFTGTGGVAGADYYLRGTTNLMIPVTSWVRLLTNQFDGNGNFLFTNPSPAAGQQFYQLQIP